MSHVQQGKNTFYKSQSFVSCVQICSLSQHNSQQDQPHNINIKIVHSTPPIMKKYADILLHYRWLFIKGNVIMSEWGIFGVEIFLCYS